MKFVDKMTFDELESELKELKLGLGGIGTKDIMKIIKVLMIYQFNKLKNTSIL